MIININCTCGNNDPNKAHFYDGALGYEAIVCHCCGKYSDHRGSHNCDEWSSNFIIKNNTNCKQIFSTN